MQGILRSGEFGLTKNNGVVNGKRSHYLMLSAFLMTTECSVHLAMSIDVKCVKCFLLMVLVAKVLWIKNNLEKVYEEVNKLRIKKSIGTSFETQIIS